MGDGLFDFSIGGFEEGALRVASFRGRERLSNPYSFDVVVSGADADDAAILERALGQPGRLVIHGPAGARFVRGVIVRAAAAGLHAQRQAAWRLRLAPRMAALKHRRNTRIFQDQTTSDIVSAILGEAGIAHRWDTQQTYAARSYCVQYEETDLEFVQRLLAEIGVFYHFEHAGEEEPIASPERVVFGDQSEYLPIDDNPRLLHRQAQQGAALALEKNHVTAFHLARALAPAAYKRRDYDFERPLSALEAAASVSGAWGEHEVYEHHGEFAEAESGHRLETSALEQLRRAEVHGGRRE